MTIVNDSYLVTARINVGEFFGVPDADAFVEIREPDTKAWFKLEAVFKSGDNEKIIEHFLSMLPALIVNHSIMKTATDPMTPDEVTGIIGGKLGLFMHVLNEYKERVLFTLGKKSGEK